jgi:hypothetical protein
MRLDFRVWETFPKGVAMADSKRPYRQRVTSSSNSSLFEKRGDPWVSQRQGLEDYGRILGTENPDLDCFTKASPAKEHRERGSDKAVSTKSDEPDTLRRAANINLRYHSLTGKASRAVRDEILVEKIRQFRKEACGCLGHVCQANGRKSD